MSDEQTERNELRYKGAYSLDEVASIMGVSRGTVKNEITRGRLIASKVGTQFRIARSDLEKYMGPEWDKFVANYMAQVNDPPSGLPRLMDIAKLSVVRGDGTTKRALDLINRVVALQEEVAEFIESFERKESEGLDK